MKIVKPKYVPKGATLCIYGENQPEYLDLPAIRMNDERGTVISCWKPSFFERLKILFIGRIYLSLLTFNKPIQPQRLDTKCPPK